MPAGTAANAIDNQNQLSFSLWNIIVQLSVRHRHLSLLTIYLGTKTTQISIFLYSGVSGDEKRTRFPFDFIL